VTVATVRVGRNGDRIGLITRDGYDWTARFLWIIEAARKSDDFSTSTAGEAWMPRTLSLVTLIFAFLSLNVCWAQNKADEPAFPFTKSIFRWDYSCPTEINCSFACPGQTIIADRLSKLRLYLGSMSIEGGLTVPAIFYEFSTREFPHASGFSIGSGAVLSCRALGMVLDYSGALK
jgi:hypothetical protein